MIAVINLGLKNIRCIVFNDEGRRISSASRTVTSYVWDKFVEQDPGEWWQKVLVVVEEALSSIKLPRDIEAITVTASASCLVVVDRDLNPLRRVIMVSDGRSLDECNLLDNASSFSRVKRETGVGATPDLCIPKMLWLKKNEPEIYEKTWKFLSPADFLLLKLGAKEAVTDINNALKYHYETEKGAYPADLYSDLGLDINKLPQVESPTYISGELSRELKEKFGISGQTKLIISTYDALCAVFGSGVHQPGQICDVSGTVTSVRGLTQHHIKDSLGRIFVLPWMIGEEKMWLAGGSNNLGGGLIEWGKQLLLPDHGEDAYEVMKREVGEIPPCARGLIFLPYLLGERAPLWDINARGVFFGLERKHTRKEMFKALFESTAFATRSLIETMRNVGMTTDEIYCSGGLARLDEISQIKADVLGIPVKVPKDFESTCFGAAIITLIGLGKFDDFTQAVKNMVIIDKTFEPDLERHILYANWFDLYQSLYANLKGSFIDRNKIISRNIYKSLCPEHKEIKENL